MLENNKVSIKILKRYEANRHTSAHSFLNPASIGTLLQEPELFKGINFYVDGILLSLLLTLFTRTKISRTSFDFTSIAPVILNDVRKNGETIFFVGGSQDEIELFCKKITKKFNGINIVGYSNGYFSQMEENHLYEEVITMCPNYVIVGLGAGKQERFSKALIEHGYKGKVYTCGAFISQESKASYDYYPNLINKLNLRFLYRMIKEPHTIKRYLINYPINLLKLFLWIAQNKITLNLR